MPNENELQVYLFHINGGELMERSAATAYIEDQIFVTPLDVPLPGIEYSRTPITARDVVIDKIDEWLLDEELPGDVILFQVVVTRLVDNRRDIIDEFLLHSDGDVYDGDYIETIQDHTPMRLVDWLYGLAFLYDDTGRELIMPDDPAVSVDASRGDNRQSMERQPFTCLLDLLKCMFLSQYDDQHTVSYAHRFVSLYHFRNGQNMSEWVLAQFEDGIPAVLGSYVNRAVDSAQVISPPAIRQLLRHRRIDRA